MAMALANLPCRGKVGGDDGLAGCGGGKTAAGLAAPRLAALGLTTVGLATALDLTSAVGAFLFDAGGAASLVTVFAAGRAGFLTVPARADLFAAADLLAGLAAGFFTATPFFGAGLAVAFFAGARLAAAPNALFGAAFLATTLPAAFLVAVLLADAFFLPTVFLADVVLVVDFFADF